jgi:hypothetical protein
MTEEKMFTTKQVAKMHRDAVRETLKKINALLVEIDPDIVIVQCDVCLEFEGADEIITDESGDHCTNCYDKFHASWGRMSNG